MNKYELKQWILLSFCQKIILLKSVYKNFCYGSVLGNFCGFGLSNV